MEIYKNSGSGFEPFEIIDTQGDRPLFVAAAGDQLFIATANIIYEYRYLNGTYEKGKEI